MYCEYENAANKNDNYVFCCYLQFQSEHKLINQLQCTRVQFDFFWLASFMAVFFMRQICFIFCVRDFFEVIH